VHLDAFAAEVQPLMQGAQPAALAVPGFVTTPA
jgi:hypothetical protein